VGAELFHADGRTDGETDWQTDVKELIVAFRNFVTAQKNISSASLEMTPNVVYSEPTRTYNVLCSISVVCES
jgi:hypothetical protein